MDCSNLPMVPAGPATGRVALIERLLNIGAEYPSLKRLTLGGGGGEGGMG